MITLRKAVADDQPTIRRMVRAECLNPRDVHWQNFLIAEDEDAIVGIGQIRLHQSCKELGSLVVLPAYRGQGVGAALIQALETQAGFPLYLMCGSHNVPYYRRFGYAEVVGGDIPKGMLPPQPVLWLVRNLFRAQIHIMRKTTP